MTALIPYTGIWPDGLHVVVGRRARRRWETRVGGGRRFPPSASRSDELVLNEPADQKASEVDLMCVVVNGFESDPLASQSVGDEDRAASPLDRALLTNA